MKQIINNFLQEVSQRNANEPEFMQAVLEVAESVIPFIENNPQYKAKVCLNASLNQNA